MAGHFHVRNPSSRSIAWRQSRTACSNSYQHRRNWNDHHLGMEDVRGPLDARYPATISDLRIIAILC